VSVRGPLTYLLLYPSRAAHLLAKDAVVVAPDDRAIGEAARALLAQQPTMKLVDRPREVRIGAWGFVQANLEIPSAHPLYVAGQLIAHLDQNTWSVVSVHYMP
jgi:hypothetical protein